jgi:5-formyltetrahydrofolate cyclo-ligase
MDRKSMDFAEKNLLPDNKNTLRQLARAKRKAVSAALREASIHSMSQNLLSCARDWPPALIAGYCAMGSEADVMPALALLSQAGHSLALPAISQNALLFRAFRIGDPLQIGPLKTLEPAKDQPLCLPTVMLVPLLAFDRNLMRLGQGAGFYDRALAELRRNGPVLAIGIAFSCQMSETPLPAEPHDQGLDLVVTEQAIYRPQTGS